MATDRKCEMCHEQEAIWAAQFIAEAAPTFYTLGGHMRGFTVTRVCDTCKVKMAEDAKAIDNLPAIELVPGTKVKFDHRIGVWTVRPYRSRDWMSVTDEAEKAIRVDDTMSKFKWYDLYGRWMATLKDGYIIDIKQVMVR